MIRDLDRADLLHLEVRLAGQPQVIRHVTDEGWSILTGVPPTGLDFVSPDGTRLQIDLGTSRGKQLSRKVMHSLESLEKRYGTKDAVIILWSEAHERGLI